MQNFLVIVLGLGIFPSFTSLSQKLIDALPGLAPYLGPINILKIAAPLLIYFIFRQRHLLPVRFRWIFLLSFGILLPLVTIVAGNQCAFPPTLFRETAVMMIGIVAAVALSLLEAQSQKRVVWIWIGFIIINVVLDRFFLSTLNTLNKNIFDPNNPVADVENRALNGLIGINSLAKMMAWVPWLLFLNVRSINWGSRKTFGLLATIVMFHGLILSTTQRGPFLAVIAGWVALAAHQFLITRNMKILRNCGVAVVAMIGLTVAIVPTPVRDARLKSMIWKSPDSEFGKVADKNRDYRIRVTKFSVEQIAVNPIGNPCLTEQEFLNAGFDVAAHAHSLFLQQYRERGWIWGTVNLALWLAALLGFWRARTAHASFLLAASVANLVMGLFDHPWFVLNHSLIIGFLLVEGFRIRDGDQRFG